MCCPGRASCLLFGAACVPLHVSCAWCLASMLEWHMSCDVSCLCRCRTQHTHRHTHTRVLLVAGAVCHPALSCQAPELGLQAHQSPSPPLAQGLVLSPVARSNFAVCLSRAGLVPGPERHMVSTQRGCPLAHARRLAMAPAGCMRMAQHGMEPQGGSVHRKSNSPPSIMWWERQSDWSFS